MATSGQTLNDRINAARYAIAGQGLARCVCKATTEEVIGPKKKHLDYLLACTHEPNVSIPQMANLLIERTNHIYWVVVFKALVTVHHLMSYGNERFTQYLASSGYSFELSTFLDKTAARDFSMSTFIRRYSRYINEKALSYRLLAFDFCKVKRGNEGVLRLMPIDRLLKTLPILQNQLDALLEFDCSANDLNNGVINACFMLLFRDLIGLFACHNDGIINLLNKYFTLNRKMCREAFDLYKKFLIRMDKVSDFLRVAEVVGIDKDEIPDLKRAPSSLIEALEQHLQNIETNKKILKQQSSTTTTTTTNNNNSKSSTTAGDGFSSVLGNLTPPTSMRPNSPGNLAGVAAILDNNNKNNNNSQSDSEFSINSFKDEEVRKALEEEARVLSQYGTFDGKVSSSNKTLGKSNKNNNNGNGNGESSLKFAVSTIPKSIDDIFGDSDSFGTTTATNKTSNGIVVGGGSGSGGNNAFDNLTGGSSNSTSAKSRSKVDSIKTTIKMATSTLENVKAAGTNVDNKSSINKKASDELFSLLDTSALTIGGNQQQNSSNNSNNANNGNNQNNPISPFSTTSTSPFTMTNPINTTNLNGQLLKKGNPFPEVVGNNNAFSTNSASSSSTSATAAFTTDFLPVTPLAPIYSHQTINNNNNSSTNSNGNSVFNNTKSALNKTSNNNSNQTTANYTNLGGLEGFGDLLQPMNSSNNKQTINNNSNNSTALGTNNLKSAFNSANTGSSTTGLFKGDLDSTLANLAQNLTFDGIKTKKQ